jgi:hypothetical protein
VNHRPAGAEALTARPADGSVSVKANAITVTTPLQCSSCAGRNRYRSATLNGFSALAEANAELPLRTRSPHRPKPLLKPRPGGRVVVAAEAAAKRWLACVLVPLRQRPQEGLSLTEARATDPPKGRPLKFAAARWVCATEVMLTFKAASRRRISAGLRYRVHSLAEASGCSRSRVPARASDLPPKR